ncbi:alpha-galactosidase A precursor [Biscogniauxia marginata]|nr:alpha-galactosidase A precursor [Biscogniauxia marginata]
MTDQPPNIQLLQASVDMEGESEFRILVNNKYVKYLVIDGGLYEPDDMCFEPLLISMLPPLPPGDWNEGRISHNSTTGKPHFSATSRTPLPGIMKTWHPLQIDHLELRMGQKLRSNVYEASCRHFSSTVIAKFARFDWEIPQLRAETAAYEWIEGHQIGPAFLGHLYEEGRVIGFIMARITDCRHATPEDLPLCRLALSKLHQLGIKHGDTNKHNFLIHNGKATIIDFDIASRGNSANELKDELDGLQSQLSDTSGRGGQVVINNPSSDF